MKRILAFVLSLIMVLSLVACGGSDSSTSDDQSGTADNSQASGDKGATALELNQSYVVDDYITFKLIKIETTDKIEASLGGFMSYSPSDGNVYVDVVVDATIDAASAINSDDLATGIAKGVAEYNYLNVFVETGSDINQYEDLMPLSTYRLHLAFSVPSTESALDLELDINGSKFTSAYTLNQKIANLLPLNVGTPVSAPDLADMTMTKVEYTEDLMPSNTSSYYTHYPVENTSNIYLVAHFDVTNLQANAKECDTFLSVKATYMDKYNYTGFVVVEDSDGTGFSQYEDISPLDTRHVVCMLEVPKTVIENPATLTINFMGTEYSYTHS